MFEYLEKVKFVITTLFQTRPSIMYKIVNFLLDDSGLTNDMGGGVQTIISQRGARRMDRSSAALYSMYVFCILTIHTLFTYNSFFIPRRYARVVRVQVCNVL